MQDIVEQINAALKDGDILAVRKLLIHPMEPVIKQILSTWLITTPITHAFIIKEYPELVPIIELYPSIATAACAFSERAHDTDSVNTPEFNTLCMLYIAYADPGVALEYDIYDPECINCKTIKSNCFWQYFWAHVPLPQRLKIIDDNYKAPGRSMLIFILKNDPFDLTLFKSISRQMRKEIPDYYELVQIRPLKLCIKKLRTRYEAANK